MQRFPPRNAEELAERYRELRAAHQVRFDALRRRQVRAMQVLVAVGAIVAWETVNSLHGQHPAWPLLLSLAAVVVLIVLSTRLQGPMEEARRLLVFYDRAIARIDGSESHSERTGEDAAEGVEGHLYQRDLDLTGARSIFSLLATVRTGIGERGLARYLLNAPPHEESVLRQEAVRELAPQVELRERIALLGSSRFQQLSHSFFDNWLNDPPPSFHPVYRYGLWLTAGLNLALIVAGVLRFRTWGELLPNLLSVSLVQMAVALPIRERIKPLLEGGAQLQSQVQMLRGGLVILQQAQFESPKLQELQRLASQPANSVKLLKKLEPKLVFLEQRNKELFYLFTLLLAMGSQAGIAIAAWKRRHAGEMRAWIAAWSEFEALNALAMYAFEHPEDVWPELLPPAAAPCFEAQALGHPLLAGGVRNDVCFNTDTRFYLVSGSNMAGKSTLLRSVGVAAVMAYAGGPVRARSLRLSPLRLGASIALTDSLAEGKSKFLAEVERLAAIVGSSDGGPLLFLVDEIFSGTNSLDRFAAAEAVLNRLLANGAIGALSTHDLALTSLASDESHGVNVHMGSPNPEDPLGFDYLLKPGVNQHTNALAIIRMMGL
jgi:hypothetical protein